MSNEQILVDSDALVGWFVKGDSNHEKSRSIFEQIRVNRLQPIVTNLVIAETATLFSYRQGQEQVSIFLDFSQNLETIYIDEVLHNKTVALMREQRRNKTSFVDMANVVVLQEFNIPQIFSFDKVYTKDFDLKLAGEWRWEK